MAPDEPSGADLPLVSIVTPTYQRANRLEGTLRSIAAQSYPRVEHIVVDGGSDDGTLELLRRYEASHGIRWISEPDRGMYDAVNKGLRLATGSIVSYLNSDDRYLPWTIEVAVSALRSANADLVYGDLLRIDELRGIRVPVFQPRFGRRRTAAFGTLYQPAVLFRREVVEILGGFDDRLRYVADLDFWLRASEQFRFVRVPEFLCVEYRHDGTLSESRCHEMADEDVLTRSRFRRGFWATPLGEPTAHALWVAWSTLRWAQFVASTWGGPGWSRSRAALRPAIGTGRAIQGLLPSRGSTNRAAVLWRAAPEALAEDGARDGTGT